MRKYHHYDLLEFTSSEVEIECSNCNNGDTEYNSEDYEACKYFFKKGWRATENNVYCPSCAKHKLKLNTMPNKKSSPKTRKVSRSAKTGKFVSAKTAKKRPASTVTETIKVPKKKGGKK